MRRVKKWLCCLLVVVPLTTIFLIAVWAASGRLDLELPIQEGIEQSFPKSLSSVTAAPPMPTARQGPNGAVTPETVVPSDADRLIDVPYISQENSLPTGCEIVSATMLLHYYGYPIDEHTLIDRYLDKQPLVFQNDQYFGPHPCDAFVGDPYRSDGFGCYAPVIVRMLNRAFDGEKTAVDTTGVSLDALVRQSIDQGRPALIWATIGMAPTTTGTCWTLSDGRTFTWKRNEHCLVLVGYDRNRYLFNDPYRSNGLVGYSKELVERRFEELGRQSIVVK